MSDPDRFEFPSLGPTGEGEPVYPPGMTKDDLPRGSRPAYWLGKTSSYAVSYQLDRPACAFRCHYPGGSSPCNKETADKFIAWCQERGF